MSISKDRDKEILEDKWDGVATKLEDFDKKIARWCRRKWGTTIGNMIWEDNLPELETLHGEAWDDHASEVWSSIEETDTTRAKMLWHIESGFWNKTWHVKWRKQQYDRLYDKVEASVEGMATLEVANLGMENAARLRKHLHRQFGGAGEDVHARQERFEAGMPKTNGAMAFPANVHMANKLRELEAERVALWKMCPPDKRDKYEYGKEATLVKIVLRHLRSSDYADCVRTLLQEIKVKRELLASIPVLNAVTGQLELPQTLSVKNENTDDWDYRNFHDDWLPTWDSLKSKLISVWKERTFSQTSKDGKGATGRLPIMFMPGAGLTPRVRCFGCGEMGHRKGDPGCTAKPDEWHECCPPAFLEKVNKRKRKGVDGMSIKKKNDGICHAFRDTGKCRFGAKCKFKHVKTSSKGSPHKKARNQKGNGGKKITFAMIRSIASALRKEVKRDESESDCGKDEGLSGYLQSIMMIRTIPRYCFEKLRISLASIAATDLVDMSQHVCYDSGSGTGVSTCEKDFVWIDKGQSAKDSVEIRGPSVGGPMCAGRGALVFRCEIDGEPFGIIHPDGVFANSEMKFRVLSERVNKARGLRVISGEFEEPDFVECIRSGKSIKMKTSEGILVMPTRGLASEIVDSPEFRKVVDDIRKEKRSPLVNLSRFLQGRERKGLEARRAYVSPKSELGKILKLTNSKKPSQISTLIFNEAKASPEERARLWSRRFGYCDTARFQKMAAMPEYGGFPRLPTLNEDSLVADQAKFKRNPFKPNDPSIRMDCPPWWRVYFDGYGGQKSLGADSYEGAVGSYIFVCCATGSLDVRLYASHEQFPVALHQFLRRVEAEHFKVNVLYGDTFSVNLSEDVEEVCALFKCTVQPVSAGTPQEMAFAESMVRVVKGMSTAMLAGAPHLPKDAWACADKYAVFVHDFLPQTTRGGHCPYYLRTGRAVNWKVLPLHVFGAPCQFAPIEGPIHKRAPITLPGHFMGVQWPAVLIKRQEDGKIISCSRQKLKVYEKVYLAPLDQSAVGVGDAKAVMERKEKIAEESSRTTAEDQEVQPGHNKCALPRQELSKNRVQSIKSLREHQFNLPGRREGVESRIENSAEFGNPTTGEEGIYEDAICNQRSYDMLTKSLQDAIKAAAKGVEKPSIRQQIVTKLKAAMDLTAAPAVQKGSLRKGKKWMSKGISSENIMEGKRVKKVKFSSSSDPQTSIRQENIESQNHQKGASILEGNEFETRRGRKLAIKVNDYISLPAGAFDGEAPGSFSDEHPEVRYGKVLYKRNDGLTLVRWLDDKQEDWIPEKDLKLEVSKLNVTNLIILLVEGEQVVFESKDKHKYPKNFFEVLVKADWRSWVESVKKELTGWNANDAVTVVAIEEVPKNAKVVPLGELYTVKRDGRYKFRQYLMGNLLRDGIDFAETFSTTVSGPGICTFFSLAATCKKWVWGWDAVCGYLQSKEQFDVYAFLPSHHGYSDLTYEELAVLRQEFLKLVEKHGDDGLKKFAAKHRRESRVNPSHVYKLNSSVYGNAGAGHEFEMLIQSVHLKTCGCTQTQPEPSMYVKIVVDKNDKVTGYLIAAAYTDDIRFFGTEPERIQYMKDVESRLKVTFSRPPVAEFVSIETHQCLETNTMELKMPRYFEKAAEGFKHLFPGGMKERSVPLSVHDETTLLKEPTPEEIEAAKHLPYRNLLGVLSYPASNCKFEMKYAISVCGSRRGGWNTKQFEVVKHILEYGYYTRHLGVIYSDGLDPHGRNVCYAYGDAGLQLPRSYGCRVVMLNGAAVSFKAKRQTVTAPSTVWAEMTTFFDTTMDVAATRNLLAELGMFQEKPTVVYGDNEAQQQIANNRGSLGPTSRAMSLKTLSARNRIEDHEVVTSWIATEDMVADIGTKSLPPKRFIKLRDALNGYSLAKAAYPNKTWPKMINNGEEASLAEVQVMLMKFAYQMEDKLAEPSHQ